MIVVDSSVWIAHLRDQAVEPVRKLRAIDTPNDILVGDLVLLDVLQGARDDLHAARIENNLRQFQIAPMLNGTLAAQAAANCRALRERGVTIRKTIVVMVATFCLTHAHALLHDDCDFEPFVQYLGLQIL